MNRTLENILVDDLKIPKENLRPDATLEAAGIDSLAVVELSVLLEQQLGVKLSETELEAAATVEALGCLVEQTRRGG
jgi:acyl carrier protein